MMRQFINLVENAQLPPVEPKDVHAPAILYHGTSIPNAAFILASNNLTATDDHDGPRGVSLTRNERIGWSFAAWKANQESTAVEENTSIVVPPVFREVGALLVLDWQAILRDYVTKQHRWHTLDDEEEEERVLSSIGNVSKYLISVSTSRKGVHVWAKVAAECVLRGEVYTSGADETILAILKHPKFR